MTRYEYDGTLFADYLQDKVLKEPGFRPFVLLCLFVQEGHGGRCFIGKTSAAMTFLHVDTGQTVYTFIKRNAAAHSVLSWCVARQNDQFSQF